jgi:Tfp pilus assembly protein PilF
VAEARRAHDRSEQAGKAAGAAAEQHARAAIAHAERALVLDPALGDAHLQRAIAYGRLTDFVSNGKKIEYSKIIGDEARRATELAPRLDMAWHVLGRWHAGLAEVGGFQRAMCKLIYGELPAATYADAARCLRRAIEIAPQKINHHAELARVLTAQKDAAGAAAEWRLVLSLSPVDEEDREYQKSAQAALR